MTDLYKLAVADGMTDADADALHEWVEHQPHGTVMDAATRWLQSAIKAAARSVVLTEECRALKVMSGDATAAPKATRNPISDEASAAATAARAAMSDVRARIDDMITAHAAALVAEWSPSLLASEISMPDGRRTTWGAATADEHQARAEMFADQAGMAVAGAARHRKAATLLRESGAVTLSDLLQNQEVAA